MRRFGWLGVLFVVLAGAACGPAGDDKNTDTGSGEQTTSSSSKPEESSGAATADPPLKFEGEPVTFKPSVVTEVAPKSQQSFVTMRDKTAYIVGGKGLGAYDVTSGEELWKVPGPEYVSGIPQEDQLLPNWPAGPLAPALSEDGKTVAAVFPYYTEAGEFVTVVVADANSGDVELKTDVQLPIDVDDNWGGNTNVVYARALAVTDKSVIITAGLDWTISETKFTFTVDRGTKKVGWKEEHFGASGVYGSNVVGTFSRLNGADIRVQALDAATGKSGWDAYPALGLSTQQADAGTVLVTYNKTSQDRAVVFLDAASGKPKRAETTVRHVSSATPFYTCVFDQKESLICPRDDLSSDKSKTEITGYDAASGEQLWQQSVELTGNVPAAWHGAVYVDNGDGGTIILDARSGKQKASFPDQGAPSYVNTYGGLRLEEDYSMTFLPVAG
jgi:hypothetical protein